MHDPVHPYAPRFIEAYARRGLRTVCLYNNPTFLRQAPHLFPDLVGPNIAANYLVDDAKLDTLAPLLKEKHHIVAVVPHVETSVLASEHLAELLDLSWAQPGVINRFRDKHSLKDYLRSVPDGPRINAIARVTTTFDVSQALGTGEFPRFVLKPNDGFGNSRIGFFDADGDLTRVEKYLAEHAGTPLLMEEFIGGDEYFADGQVDGQGEVTVVSVWRAVRVAANGRPNVTAGFRTLGSDRPEFIAAATYAESVVRASGLRRSPFHLELKIDDRGPCLIEVGARLVGAELALEDSEMHGSLDVVDLAAHYYLTDDDYGPTGVDWQHYDSRVRSEITGISEVSGRIFEVTGLDAVEAHPAFIRWHHKPAIGDRLTQTVDLFGQPWAVVVEAPDEQSLDEIEAWLRATIRINPTSTGLRRETRRLASTLTLARRAANRVMQRLPIPGRSRIVVE